jgi:hypothetical protein
MRIGRWLAVIAIATVCAMLFVQGGVADAASSTTQHTARRATPVPHHAYAFGTTSTVPLRVVDLRFAAGTTTTTT